MPASMSFARAVVPVAATGMEGERMDLTKSLWMGLVKGLGSGVASGLDGVWATSEGCEVSMSLRIWMAMICNSSWPFAKQWRKRVRFSWARLCN